MFTRPESNYQVSEDTICGMLADHAHPVIHICKILQDGDRVLDIGCGSGVLARAISKYGKKVAIDGIEPNICAAELAKPHYRTIKIGYAENFFYEIKNSTYDYIVLADVIEHIADPYIFLKNLLGVVPKSTKLLISIPNIAFGGIRLSLLNGNFDYVDSGLLEKTHLRFFSLTSIKELIFKLGLNIESVLLLQRSFYNVEFPRDQLKSSLLQAWKLASNSDARAYQYLILISQNNRSEAFKTESYGANRIQVFMDYFPQNSRIHKFMRYFIKG